MLFINIEERNQLINVAMIVHISSTTIYFIDGHAINLGDRLARAVKQRLRDQIDPADLNPLDIVEVKSNDVPM